jgi:capsule polysaccharide export protein KpsC/LpsZ
MARDRVGLATWEDFPEEEKEKLLEMEIWKREVYERWIEEKEAEELKRIKKMSKGKKRRQRYEDEEGDEDTYVD